MILVELSLWMVHSVIKVLEASAIATKIFACVYYLMQIKFFFAIETEFLLVVLWWYL